MAIKTNKPIHITTKEHFQFDQKYWDEYSGGISYDVNRPIRRIVHKRISLLPSTASLISFAFDTGERLSRYSRLFRSVYGYDINPASIKDAARYGFDKSVVRQDVTKHLFKSHFPKATMASCYYLFEHLQDGQVVEVCLNMMCAADMNLVKLTTSDDPNYIKDPSHLNPKLSERWNIFLQSIYTAQGWIRLSWHIREWCFVRKPILARLKNAQLLAARAVDQAWLS